MNRLVAAALGLLMLSGVPALADDTDQPEPIRRDPSTLMNQQPQQPEDPAFASMKSQYVGDVRTKLHEWREKIRDLGQKTKGDTSDAVRQANMDLRKAWFHAASAARSLSHTTKEKWDEAKAGYEQAAKDLQDKWQSSGQH